MMVWDQKVFISLSMSVNSSQPYFVISCLVGTYDLWKNVENQ